MNYYSLNDREAKANTSFKEATTRGQAPDKGLYFPEWIPEFPKTLIDNIGSFTKEEIALQVIKPYVGTEIPTKELEKIVAATVNFDFPLVKLDDDKYSLELFHGPTLAFKDVGARFMSRCLAHFVSGNDQPITVLVATSGDTGGAVANGFYDVDGVKVVILYPSGKVSSVQELQLTTLGKNITALEVDGTFDDCQRMVKQAFADQGLNENLFLTSANSINVARWLPQQFYYLFAYRLWVEKTGKTAPLNPPVVSVPSGNFGNICAGLLAHRSGLPVKHFIAACNANNTVPDFLQTGHYQPRKAVATLSNAMDVGDPSNFVRILEIFHKEFKALSSVLTSFSISDEQTTETIRKVFSNFHYLPDPHGAVGYLALEKYLSAHPGEKGIFLETAHPVKFYDVVEPIVGQQVPMPASVKSLLGKEKQSKKITADFTILKDFLLADK